MKNELMENKQILSSTAPESKFLHELFYGLNEANIGYTIMRNYESLPWSVGESDLDILISPHDELEVRAILLRSIIRAYGAAIGCSSTLGFFKVFTFGCNPHTANSWWGVRVDVNVGYNFKGAAAIDLGKIFNFQTTHNGIKVLEPGFAAVLGMLKEFLNNSLMPERYQVKAAQAVQADWQLLSSALSPMGEKSLVLLRQMILAGSGEADVPKQSRFLRWALVSHAFRGTPVAFIRNRFLHEWGKVRRYLRPSGAIVAVLGVDGVGKSTVINSIKSVLEDATHGALEIKHLRPGLLPPLARLKGKQIQQEGLVTDPHGSKSSGRFVSLLRISYLMADYVLGYWLVVRPIIAKCPAIVLFDRYAYDMALDPRRFRIGLPDRLVRWFTRIAPNPDLIICLHGDPAVIVARKQELPLEEVERQTEALLEFAKHDPRAVLVSTEGPVEQVRDDVLNTLKQFLLMSKVNQLEGLLYG
jgi:thymidylate kinase